MPIFNKEELKIVIKAFAVNVKKAKSNRDKAKKDPTNRKKKKEDGDNERFSREDHVRMLMTQLLEKPLGKKFDLEPRLKKFVDVYISKVNPTKKLLLSMLPVPIQEKHKKTGRDHLLSLVMTENEMAQNKEESQVMLFEDPLHLLDRLPFYSETAKVQAGIFHSMENRVENLSKCFAECLTIHQKEQQKVKGAKGKSNGPRKTVTLMEKVILDILKINLPWKTQSVIESVEACSENSTFVQIYLCPLRQHYGKTKGSKTGDLLSMIENHFWTGIQKLM
jgi:hypothetical protein